MKMFFLFSVLSFLLCTTAYTQNLKWKSYNGITWSQVNDVTLDKKGNIFISIYKPGITRDYRSQGTIYRSKDNGITWEELIVSKNYFGVNQVFIDDVDGKIYVVQDWNGLNTSSDNGKTWVNISSNFYTKNIKSIIKNSKGTLFVCTFPDDLYSSNDKGASWTKVIDTIAEMNDFRNFFCIHDTLFRCDNNNIFRSTDDGLSWKRIILVGGEGVINCDYIGSHIYVVTWNRSLYKMDVHDDSLIAITNKFNMRVKRFIILEDSSIVSVMENDGLYKYDLNLNNEKKLITSTPVSMVKKLSGRIFVGTTTGVLETSSDNGNYFRRINDNLINKNITDIISKDKGTTYVIENKSKLYVSVDTSNSWYSIIEDSIFANKLMKIVLDNNYKLYLFIEKSGFFEVQEQDSIIPRNNGINSSIISISYDSSRNIFAITDDGVYKFNPDSMKWSLENGIIKKATFINKKNTKLLALSENFIYVYFTKTNNVYPINITSIKSSEIFSGDITSTDKIIIGTKNNGVYSSSDFGLSWKESNNQLTSYWITGILTLYQDRILAGTYLDGIYYSNNEGDTWQVNNQGLSSLSINLIETNGNLIYAGTRYNGLNLCDSINDTTIDITSGWIDSSLFKQQIMQITAINYIKFSVDDSRIFTFSSDKFFRIWDSKSGKLIEEVFLNFGNIRGFDFIENKNYMAVASDSVPICTYIYYYKTDSILIKINPLLGKPTSDGPVYKYNNYLTLFNKNRNQIYTVLDIYMDSESIMQTGALDVWDIITGEQIKSLGGLRTNGIKLSNSNNIITIYGWSSYSTPRTGESTFGAFARLFYLDSFGYLQIGDASSSDDVITHLDFSHDDHYICYSTVNNHLFLYDINSRNIFKEYFNGQNLSDYSPKDIVFSKNSYEFYSNSVSKINNNNISYLKKWYYNISNPIDSIEMGDPNESWKLDISHDSKSLVAGSNSGKIRLIDITRLKVDVLSYSILSPEIILFPNPANDYIEFSDGLKVSSEVIIYTLIGQILYKGSTDNKIDVSGYYPGVYFVKLQNKIYKFIKF